MSDTDAVEPTSNLRDEDDPTVVSEGLAADAGEKPAPRYITWKTGSVVAGRYLVRRNLGVGGTGLVVVADDLLLRKPVAVKALRPSVASEPDNLERFRKEVALCHAVTHPNIVRTYDLGEDGGIHYFSMEYLTGEPLSKRLRREKKLPPDEVRRIGIHICRALHAAHEANVVHRDLKPSNIMLVKDSREVVVMDFGISGVLHESEEGAPVEARPGPRRPELSPQSPGEWDVTSAGWGTPKYMSPEQWAGQPCGPPSDIYSLGAILFQCLTGAPPFEGHTDRDYAAAHMSREAPAARSLDPGVPRSLDHIIARCLEKSPSKRYQNARVLEDALAGRRRVPGWLKVISRAVGLAMVLFLLGWGIMEVAHRAIIREMRPAVSRLAELAAQQIDPEELDLIREATDYTRPEFERMRTYFLRLTSENPEIHFIYTLRAHDDPGLWEFVVDRDPFPEDDNRNGLIDPEEIGSMPGQHYDGRRFPAMTRALAEGRPTADDGFNWDPYGLTLSGYAPIGDNRGPGGYVLGIDINNARLVWFDRIVIGLCFITWLLLLLGPKLTQVLGRPGSRAIPEPPRV